MWQESNRSTHNHNTHKHTSPSPKLVPAVSVCCDRVASINQGKLMVISLWRHLGGWGGGCQDGGVSADFKKRTIFIFGTKRWFVCNRCHIDLKPEWQADRGQDMHLRGSVAFKLTVLLEDMELRVLRLLASVTTIAEGKRDGWEYWGGSCLWEYTVKGKQGGI